MTLCYLKPALGSIAALTAAAVFGTRPSILKIKSFVLIGLCTFAAVLHLHADVVVSVTGTSTGGGSSVGGIFSQVLVSSWSSLNAYSDVKVSAELGTFDPTTTGTAFLMNMIGPGTTTANQIATANYTVSSPNSTLIPLFSRLDLLSGSYYLVLAGPTNGNVFWRQTFNDATITTAPSVALTDFGFAHTAGTGVVNFGYFPSSEFALTPNLRCEAYGDGNSGPRARVVAAIWQGFAVVAFGKRPVRITLACQLQSRRRMDVVRT